MHETDAGLVAAASGPVTLAGPGVEPMEAGQLRTLGDGLDPLEGPEHVALVATLP